MKELHHPLGPVKLRTEAYPSAEKDWGRERNYIFSITLHIIWGYVLVHICLDDWENLLFRLADVIVKSKVWTHKRYLSVGHETNDQWRKFDQLCGFLRWHTVSLSLSRASWGYHGEILG